MMNPIKFENLAIKSEELSKNSGAATDWGKAAKGAVYGVGIGAGLCTVGGVMTAGATWVMTSACAWAGAKLGGSVAMIADSLN